MNKKPRAKKSRTRTTYFTDAETRDPVARDRIFRQMPQSGARAVNVWVRYPKLNRKMHTCVFYRRSTALDA